MKAFATERNLRVPAGLVEALDAPAPELSALLYGTPGNNGQSLYEIAALINESAWPLPNNLIPLVAVDERSIACVVVSDLDGAALEGEGAVVRWHLDVADERHQASLLDTDWAAYLDSCVEELRFRAAGLDRVLNEIGPAYDVNYLGAERRPRDFVVRPVRIACQNVIVALGALAFDSSIDGMSIVAWQTCEVPHVLAHEANRALAALMLCDAFQSGGTMEIRFDRPARIVASGRSRHNGELVEIDARYAGHPEGRVPASLRRYGRTVGIALGGKDGSAISPDEARALFLAVTPMPDSLRARVLQAVDAGLASPERLCFTLLSSQLWKEIELDFMLAISARTGSIIRGGASWRDRSARQAESNVSRAALMLGMFFRRLIGMDGAGSRTEDARVLEDSRRATSWEAVPDVGAVRFNRVSEMLLPWVSPAVGAPWLAEDSQVTVLMRTALDQEIVDLAAGFTTAGVVGIIIPRGAVWSDGLTIPPRIAILECPLRESELDIEIERKLLIARTARQ